MPFLGWVVKEKSTEHPRGLCVSGRFQTQAGAQTMKELLERQSGVEGKQYYIEELLRNEKI